MVGLAWKRGDCRSNGKRPEAGALSVSPMQVADLKKFDSGQLSSECGCSQNHCGHIRSDGSIAAPKRLELNWLEWTWIDLNWLELTWIDLNWMDGWNSVGYERSCQVTRLDLVVHWKSPQSAMDRRLIYQQSAKTGRDWIDGKESSKNDKMKRPRAKCCGSVATRGEARGQRKLLFTAGRIRRLDPSGN